jgi:putative membrane protein
MTETNSLDYALALIGFLVPFNQLPELVVSSLIFSGIGIVLFALAYLIIVKASPFSIRKEIEQDQNVALAIVIASVILGIAIILAAAVSG